MVPRFFQPIVYLVTILSYFDCCLKVKSFVNVGVGTDI